MSTSTQLHPPPPSSFQSPPSSLQHPQQYLNQNIARNWAISPNLGRKIKSCPFWLKIDAHGILEVLIPNPDLDFEILTPKSIFGQIWAQKVKVVRFVRKLVHIVSQRCWFQIQTYIFEISTPKSILGKFGPKKSKLFVWPKSLYTWYLEDADSYFNICFLNFELKIQFWPNLGQKSQIYPFCLIISRLEMQILIPRLVFWILKPKFI